MNTDTDRERGVLSPADRAYLLGEREMNHEQSKRNAEARIRRRIHAATLDFDLLLHTLPEKTANRSSNGRRPTKRFSTDFGRCSRSSISAPSKYGVDFEAILEPAVRSSEEYLAATNREETVSVDVTFDVETTVESSLGDLTERLAAQEPVTPRELFSIVMQGDYDATRHDRITVVRTADGDGEPSLERLAAYLDGELRHVTDSRAVIDLEAVGDSDDH